MTFSDLNVSKRTDASFLSQTDEDRHLGRSLLLKLSIGMVSAFPIDYMLGYCKETS